MKQTEERRIHDRRGTSERRQSKGRRGSQRTTWPSGVDVKWDELTKEQWDALAQVRIRHDLTDNVEILPGLDYIMVQVGTNLTLGIELDGHTHS